MPMNLVIQERRKELGLTQEQVAEYLNVSIPAVSKWEKGSTCPDISLLPPLARLLKIDLNTLFCFQEDMTQQEIGYFCKEIISIVQTNGIAAGFETAKKKMHEYPHNEELLHCLTLQLDSLLAMSGLSHDEKHQYEDMLTAWYRRLSDSHDSKIKNSALYMMVSRFIRKGDYDKAQEVLDIMPDNDDMISSIASKQMLQIAIYQHQGKLEKAAKALQSALLLSLNKVQMLLCKLVDIELASGKVRTAKCIAEKAQKMPTLFDLWEYNSLVAPLEIALSEKNTDECIAILREMLSTMLRPWDMRKSPLFYHIAKSSDPKKMLPAVLSDMEGKPQYDFLQGCDEFRDLIAEYRALLENR